MSKHYFNFDGGYLLSKMSASWFISYYYFNHIDKDEKSWQTISTFDKRISVYNNSQDYHKYWIEKISKMNVKKLNTNTIGLTGSQIINMTNKILNKKR